MSEPQTLYWGLKLAEWLTISGLIVAIIQLRNVLNNMRVQSLNTAIRYLIDDDDTRKFKKALLADELSVDITNLDKDRYDKLWNIATMYDRYVTVGRISPTLKKDLARFQRYEIKKIWEKLRPFIEDIRQKKERQGYCEDLEDMYEYLTAEGIIRRIRYRIATWLHRLADRIGV